MMVCGLFAVAASVAVQVLPPEGTNLHFKAWNDTMPRDEAYIFRPPVADFTPYDRCVLDYIYFGEDGESIHLYFAGDTEVFGKTDVLANRRVLQAGLDRWVFDISKWPNCTDPHNVTRIRLGKDHSEGGRVLLKAIALVAKGSALPPVPETSEREGQELQRYIAARDGRHAELRASERRKFVDACRGAGLSASPLAVGVADSMSQIRPRDGFDASLVRPAASASLRLARGEHEALQIVVLPTAGDGEYVSVKCEGECNGLKVTCSPLGYVKTVAQPSNARGCRVGGRHGARPTGIGWWPDPILSYTNGCRIAAGDVQSFWIDVFAPSNAVAGTRALTLKVNSFAIPFKVRVDGFLLPATSPLPVLVTFNPRARLGTIGKEAYDASNVDHMAPMNAWKRHRDEWGDFLADHYVMMDNLYTRALPYADQLVRMRDQGRLGAFTLGYWNPQYVAESEWRAKHLADFRKAFDFCKTKGLLSQAWLYGADEVPERGIPGVDRAAAILRREFPEVGVMTTAYDFTFGCVASNVTAFCPLTPKYAEHIAEAAAAKRRGRQVWWYICMEPHAPYANMYVECPPIEARLLMGAMTAKYRPDGFLYYEIAYWNSRRPISGGPFTNWTPVTLPRYHGDGSWVCCGPDGIPLSTQRFENFRDGLDDFAYVKLLESKGMSLDVPPSVVESLTNFTDSASAVYAWRNCMADMIGDSP